MRKIFLAMLIIFLTSSSVNAAESPSCVLMKFTDDTRFDLVESADSLSDLVMEKLIASKKFRLMETNPIKEDIEVKLYNEKLRDLRFLEEAIKKSETPAEIPIAENPKVDETAKVETPEDLKVDEVKKVAPPKIDLTPLFEGVGFDEKRAQSIATAQVGQIIDPAITSEIGKQHNAEYLIQGTIINLGTGNWWNEDFEKISSAMNALSGLANPRPSQLEFKRYFNRQPQTE